MKVPSKTKNNEKRRIDLRTLRRFAFDAKNCFVKRKRKKENKK